MITRIQFALGNCPEHWWRSQMILSRHVSTNAFLLPSPVCWHSPLVLVTDPSSWPPSSSWPELSSSLSWGSSTWLQYPTRSALTNNIEVRDYLEIWHCSARTVLYIWTLVNVLSPDLPSSPAELLTSPPAPPATDPPPLSALSWSPGVWRAQHRNAEIIQLLNNFHDRNMYFIPRSMSFQSLGQWMVSLQG